MFTGLGRPLKHSHNDIGNGNGNGIENDDVTNNINNTKVTGQPFSSILRLQIIFPFSA